MVDDPLEELRHIRRNIEQACAERGQTYAQLPLAGTKKIYRSSCASCAKATSRDAGGPYGARGCRPGIGAKPNPYEASSY